MALVSLLTDFGLRDYYVAAVRGTLLRLAPGCRLVDLGHQIEAGDIESAGLLLASAAPSFPTGTVHLAVVDPGVGSRRRILAARGMGMSFVAPDNGLLTQLRAAGSLQVISVERSDLYLPAPGGTFHGRDRFAPVAAYLARGEPFAALGPEISDAVELAIPQPRRGGDRLVGRVAHVDRFGNLITDLPADWLGARRGDGVTAQIGGHRTGRWIDHYAELSPGEAGFLVGSRGTIELSLNGESLSRLWGVVRGAPVEILLD